METWKPVLDFEGLYEVSNLGNVRRIARSKTLDATKIPNAKQMFEHGATLKEVATFWVRVYPPRIPLSKVKLGQEMRRIGQQKFNCLKDIGLQVCAKMENTLDAVYIE